MAKKNKGVAAAATEAAASIPQGSANGSEDGGEKEGSFLLGQPTWEDAGGGRWRCAETGHELPEWEKDAYAQSRACRLALIENAVARKKPPLNAFKPHPEHKSKLVCNITGDTVNKSEEHIWKHINGKRFLNKLGIWMKGRLSSQMKHPIKTSQRRTRIKLLLSTLLYHETLNQRWMTQMILISGCHLLEVVGMMMMEKTDGSPLRGRKMLQRLMVHLVAVVMIVMTICPMRMMLNQGNLLQAGQSECHKKQLGPVVFLHGRKSPKRISDNFSDCQGLRKLFKNPFCFRHTEE